MDPTAYWQKHAQAFAGLYEKPTWFNRVFRKAMYLRTRMAVDAIRATPGASVLDIGCGPGGNSVLFIKEGLADRVVGVDLSENMIAMANELARRHGVEDRCEFVTGDFMDYNLGSQKFDYCVALGVMDYIRDPVPMLAKVCNATRRQFMATYPSSAPVRMMLRRIRYRLRGSNVFAFSPHRIAQILEQAGFARHRVVRCTLAGWMGYAGPIPTSQEAE